MNARKFQAIVTVALSVLVCFNLFALYLGGSQKVHDVAKSIIVFAVGILAIAFVRANVADKLMKIDVPMRVYITLGMLAAIATAAGAITLIFLSVP